jgi:uncharacterized protein YndB with AHSA1/START domain
MRIETTDDVIRIEVDLVVPLRRAWALLTQEAHIARWWGDHVSLQARPGGTFRETWSDGVREVVTAGEVTRCEPPIALELTWADDDWPAATKVAIHLSENGDGTRVVLTHSGWGIHPPDKRQAMIEGHARGWSDHLAALAAYAAKERGHSALEEASCGVAARACCPKGWSQARRPSKTDSAMRKEERGTLLSSACSSQLA